MRRMAFFSPDAAAGRAGLNDDAVETAAASAVFETVVPEFGLVSLASALVVTTALAAIRIGRAESLLNFIFPLILDDSFTYATSSL